MFIFVYFYLSLKLFYTELIYMISRCINQNYSYHNYILIMRNLLKSCLSCSKLGNKAISKTLPIEVLSSKSFITNPKAPFFTTPIRYYFWKQNIPRKDQRNQSKYAQQFLTFYKYLNIAVSKLQSLLKSLKQQEEQLDTAFLEGSKEKPSQQVIQIVELVKAFKSKTIQIERSMLEGVQLIHENKINKGLLQLFNLMQKKCQQRAEFAERVLTLASKLSKDKVDPKLMRIFEYLGEVKQQEQIKDSLAIAYTSTSAISKMDTNTNKKSSKYFLNNQQLGLFIAIIGLIASYYFYTSNFERQIQLDKKALQQGQLQSQLDKKALLQAQRQSQLDKKALQQGQLQSKIRVQQTEELQEKALAQQHKNVVSMKDCAYLEGSTIERELKTIIDSFSDQVKMVVGCPGHGKSTALKKILSERKENSDFFFFTFQSIQDQADCEKASKDLLSSLYGIKKIYKGSPLRDKKVKIVIDDINRIQELKDQGFAQRILTLIYTFAQSKSLDLICISSSSTFVEKYYNNNQFNKAFQTFILQSEHSEEFIQNFFITKLRQKYAKYLKMNLHRSQVFWKELKAISKQVFYYGFSPRFIQVSLVQEICKKLQEMENQGLLRKLNQDKREQFQIKEILKIVKERKSVQDRKNYQLLKDFNPSNSDNYKKALRKMNQQKQFNLDNCILIGSGIPLFRSMVEYLNRQNLIMFCRPRTRKERAAFESYIRNSQQKLQ